jgi:hypothetical protein
MVHRFLAAMGRPTPAARPFDRAPIRRANEMATGQASSFDFDMSQASYVVSFGAEILESDRSPVRFARALAEMRQGRPGRRGKLVMVGPRLSLTAANADEWVPARPDAALDLALAISAVLLERVSTIPVSPGRGRRDSTSSGFRPGAGQSLGGRGKDRRRPEAIERLALELAENRPAVALAGDASVGSRRRLALARGVAFERAPRRVLRRRSAASGGRDPGFASTSADTRSLAAELSSEAPFRGSCSFPIPTRRTACRPVSDSETRFPGPSS